MKRSPAGAFISRDAMLGAWLPVMLSWVWITENRLTDMLGIAARYCETEAAEVLDNNARTLREFPGKPDDPMSLWGVSKAERWSKRRDVLLEAITKLRAI